MRSTLALLALAALLAVGAASASSTPTDLPAPRPNTVGAFR